MPPDEGTQNHIQNIANRTELEYDRASGFTDHLQKIQRTKENNQQDAISKSQTVENYRSQDSGSSTDLKTKNGMK